MANNYESSVRCNEWAGLYQGGDGYNIGLKYAVDGKNFDVRGGTLCPMTALTVLPGEIPADGIGTLMALTRRYDTSGNADGSTFLVVAAGGALYTRSLEETEWTKRYEGFTNDNFDFVTYEVNERNGEPTPTPVDVLLFTNADDGMYCLYSDDLSVGQVTIHPEGAEEVRFGIICRHAERIWGSGIKGDPDKLMYSAPYNPFDWEQNNEIPEDGAGDILQPSWDGDRFVALRNYGSYLLAFKKERVWRLIGTNPGEYYMKEQYGGGAIIENSVAVYGDIVLMLGYEGLMAYDGSGVAQFKQEAVKAIMRRLSPGYANTATAAVMGDTYYLALPLDGSADNNAVLEYNFTDRTFALREGVGISSFLSWSGEMYALSRQAPAQVCTIGHGEGSGAALPMKWVSGFQDMGARNVTKSAFAVYLMSETGVAITVRVETEKKLKTKNITLKPGIPKIVRLNTTGRYIRFIFETGQVEWWNLTGGYEVHFELDYD
jgi:hypothetical protein